MFLFHTGSIKSEIPSADSVSQRVHRFYSILVRLKVKYSELAIEYRDAVSIPYWFD